MTDQAQEHVRRIAELCGWQRGKDERGPFWHNNNPESPAITARNGTLTPAGALAALEKAGTYDIQGGPVDGERSAMIRLDDYGTKWFCADNLPDAIRDALGQALKEGE